MKKKNGQVTGNLLLILKNKIMAEEYTISNPPLGKKFDEEKLPLGVVIQKQFPNALLAVAKCSQYGHKKYKDDVDWLNYQRVDDWYNRYSNAAMRHFVTPGNDKESGLPHIYHTLWNLLALVEKIELNK